MKGLIICRKNDEYKGVFQEICLSEYIEDKKLGSDVEAFISRYVDEDSQLIECSAYSIYDAKQLCDKIEKRFGDECEVVAFSDVDESIASGLEFIGFDSCAEDYYTSVVGMGYFIKDFDVFDDEPFFEEMNTGVRVEYGEQLNEYGLFESEAVADEITEYCNYLVDEYCDMFQGAENFRTVKIYM